MALHDETVPLPHLRERGGRAELRLLDGAAGDADQMVMVTRLAGDEPAAVQPPDGSELSSSDSVR